MNPEHDFGKRLRQLRTARDLTQEALAETVGCASQTVRSFEIGRRRPSREMAARLADVLEVPTDERAAFLRLARMPLEAATKSTAHTDASPQAAPSAQRVAPPSLPAEGLIGRHHDLERLRHALMDEHQRLVTLLGPGGIGKTRLALQTATNLAPHFAEGTAFVALASAADGAGVVAAIATAVGCPLSNLSQPDVALTTFLRGRTLLLVLDNLEHLLGPDQGDAIADLLTAILRESPSIHMLVTSRERLRLQAEWVVEIGGLRLPRDDQPSSIARSDAVLLFVERARRITGDFALDTHNQTTVAQICRRLDGLPLALELAAAQISFLPPTVLLARLDQALPLLEGGARDLPTRQRTMRATIGWSYDLLPEKERRVFERLGVLVGSFSLAAAEAIGAGVDVAPTEVLGLLRRLVDRSLVVRENTASDDVRYRLLEPVRQYALEQLEAHVDEANAARQRHAAYFATLAEQIGPQLRMPQAAGAFVRVLTRIDHEYPNIRTATAWALATKQPEVVAQIGWGLYTFWWRDGQPREPRAWMQAALANHQHLGPRTHARILLALLVTMYGGPASQSLPVGQEAFALFEQVGDLYGQAHTLLFIGIAWSQGGDLTQALKVLELARVLTLRLDDPWLTTQVASITGLMFAYTGQYVQATAWLNDVLATAKANQDTWNTTMSLFNHAYVAHMQGDVERIAHYCRSWLECMPLSVMINVNRYAVAYSLEGVAVAAALHGEHIRAARLFGVTETLWKVEHTLLQLPKDNHYNHLVARLRDELATPMFATAWAEGRAMNVTQAVRYALEVTSPDA